MIELNIKGKPYKESGNERTMILECLIIKVTVS